MQLCTTSQAIAIYLTIAILLGGIYSLYAICSWYNRHHKSIHSHYHLSVLLLNSFSLCFCSFSFASVFFFLFYFVICCHSSLIFALHLQKFITLLSATSLRSWQGKHIKCKCESNAKANTHKRALTYTHTLEQNLIKHLSAVTPPEKTAHTHTQKSDSLIEIAWMRECVCECFVAKWNLYNVSRFEHFEYV